MALSQWPSVIFVGLSVLMLRSTCQGVCPHNWVYMQGSCYMFSNKVLNWYAARLACEALGSKLVVINSQAEEQAIMSKLIPENQMSATWIGLYRDPNDKSRWLWVDGSRPTYTNWRTGEPNNVGMNEDCIELHSKSYGSKWNDIPCDNGAIPYICETRGGTQSLIITATTIPLIPTNSRSVEMLPTAATNISFTPVVVEGFTATAAWGRVTSSMIERGVTATLAGGGGVSATTARTTAASSMGIMTTKSDIDKCAVSNGGCSHKCVNTAGGYKCECPDPELSLSLDNKTCHASGVDVPCNSKNMTIIIPKSLLRGLDREHLRLLDTKCKAQETSSHFSLTTPLTGCNTTRRLTPTAIVYSNTVLEIPVATEDVVTRVREIEIPFSCFLSKYGVVSSVGWKPSNRKLVFSDEGKGNFTLSLNMFPDKRFVSPYMTDDFPVAVVMRERLFFEVSVTSDDKQLSIIADRCYATPTQDQTNSLKYEFIKKGCPNDVTVQYHSAPSVSAQRFSLEAFKFIADHPFAFVHCHVTVCNATNPVSQCVKKCPSSGREKREASDHMTDTYFLAEGPLHLARDKREEKRGKVFNESGSSPTFLVALFVMCVACLAGTALMIFKKSRDKPAGYTLLVSEDQK